ncbi:hypothetical protein MRX96_010988 [Rhipicephalus microplus]
MKAVAKVALAFMMKWSEMLKAVRRQSTHEDNPSVIHAVGQDADRQKGSTLDRYDARADALNRQCELEVHKGAIHTAGTKKFRSSTTPILTFAADRLSVRRRMPYGLVVALALLWMATRTHASDLVFLYPTITFPRNITMGLGQLCQLPFLEVPSEGRYISHLELRELEDIDAGRYTCDAKVRLDNLNLVQVVPDSVYLSVADYKKAHWSQPCLQLQTMKTCVDANTACLRDQPPSRTTPTGWSCQCLDQFPIYISALGRCGKRTSYRDAMNEIRRKFLDVCAVVPRKTDLRESDGRNRLTFFEAEGTVAPIVAEGRWTTLLAQQTVKSARHDEQKTFGKNKSEEAGDAERRNNGDVDPSRHSGEASREPQTDKVNVKQIALTAQAKDDNYKPVTILPMHAN